jgi:peptidoglycan/xylan/chitin deacetylase (PgdA/CDA1 family)
MTHTAYLTIDDSPSTITDELIDFLSENEIPALIFARGDLLEANPKPLIKAIEKGFILGNHLYSHQRSSLLSIEQIKEEITKTEALINNAYTQAGRIRTLKTIRFPYLDRGMGAWFIEPDKITNPEDKNIYEDLITIGLGNNKQQRPTQQQIDSKNEIQDFLKSEGFTAPTFPECTAPWYTENPCIKNAADTLITCSSSDWMLTQRHLGNWPYKDTKALTNKMMERFNADTGAQIILLHDQDELLDTFTDFITQLKENNVNFLSIT